MKNLGPKQIISDAAVTLRDGGGIIFSPLIKALEFYTKQSVGLPKRKKQKFNQPQLGQGTYLFDCLKKPRGNGGWLY